MIECETAFERFPALRDHISRMAITGNTGSVHEWSDFLGVLNAALVSVDLDAKRKALHQAACVVAGWPDEYPGAGKHTPEYYEALDRDIAIKDAILAIAASEPTP